MNMITSLKPVFSGASLILTACLLFSVPVAADDPDTLFLSDEVLNLELRSNFTEIMADTADDPESHDGKLIYRSPDGKTKKFSVKVRARGDFRRDPEMCSFPPLLLNFKKKEVKNTIFRNQDKLKLVTPCQREEDVVEEYVIYRMYNEVTDMSMKVRLVKIRYFDTYSGKELFERHSFFIEDEDHVAKRNNAFKKNIFHTPFDLDRENFMRMSVFEYLIGNKDWFITSRRNIVIIQPQDTTKAPWVVPYDFDFAALIDASYTRPRIVSEEYLSTRRVYKGLCYTDDEFKRTFDFYRKLKPVFESIIDGQELISKATRRENIRYLERFYSIIEDREQFEKEFLETCETRKMYNLPEL